ncbi:hypothetical protein [Oceanibaculum indicum]|uniref:Uncharacterized protein n=1 Tax=Oceanibaculum indicum P24 TaxID=1207063 RepID=K2JV76_9PROT|nr:hypothetical protein [Oceanibaculum indicum]EKE78472.1 hypothetical protein P24_02891 [Oceanibaculum indicum P24]
MEGSGHPDSVLHGEKNRKRRERENSPWYQKGKKGFWPLIIVLAVVGLYAGNSRDNKLPRVDPAKVDPAREEARLEQVRRDLAAKEQYAADTAALEAAKPDILKAVMGMQLVKDAAWAQSGFLYVGVIDNGKSRDMLAWQACNNVLNHYQGSREVTVVVVDIAKMLARGSFDEIGRAYCK